MVGIFYYNFINDWKVVENGWVEDYMCMKLFRFNLGCF